MKILVERVGGEKELIELVKPVGLITEGEKLDSFISGDGKTHYFTKEGLYEGWSVPRPKRCPEIPSR